MKLSHLNQQYKRLTTALEKIQLKVQAYRHKNLKGVNATPKHPITDLKILLCGMDKTSFLKEEAKINTSGGSNKNLYDVTLSQRVLCLYAEQHLSLQIHLVSSGAFRTLNCYP